MKVLVFDTETTGLPQRNKYGKKASINETTYWPHIIQLSYILYDTEKHKIVIDHDHIVKIPDYCTLTEKSIEMHGITRERSLREGISIKDALELFSICVEAADMIIAHNISFDRQIVIVESIRHRMKGPFYFKDKSQFFCTMKNTVELCQIKTKSSTTGETYLKFPRLSELHYHMFGEEPQNTHNSFVDILICLRCYIMLTKGVDIREKNRKFQTFYKSICPSKR